MGIRAYIVQDQIERDFIVRPHMVDKVHKLTFASLETCTWLRPAKICAFVKVWVKLGPGSEKLMARRRYECFLFTGSSLHR